MNKRNSLYYVAAAGAVVLLVVAIVGLSSGGSGKAAASVSGDAVRNAYEQGYLDGYSKGYQEAYTTTANAYEEQIRTMYATPTRTGCATSGCTVPSTNDDEDGQSEES